MTEQEWLAAIDDAGLTPREFRVYCRIHTMFIQSGRFCQESAPKIAADCGMNVKTVRKALATLARRNLIEVCHQSGKASLLTPNIVCA